MSTPDAAIPHVGAKRAAGKRRFVWLLLVVSALACLVWWLLISAQGRDVLLGQIVARLPPGIEVTWSQAEGPAAGPLIVHDLRVLQRSCPDEKGTPVAWPHCKTALITTFTAKRVVLDLALQPLFGKRVRLDALQVSDAVLTLPENHTPFELPRWPESLPNIAPPLSLQADAMRIDRLNILRSDQSHQPRTVIEIATLRGGVDAQDGQLHLAHIAAVTDRGYFTLHGDYAPRDRYHMNLLATAVLPAVDNYPPARLGLVARGDLRALDIALAGNAPAPLHVALHLQDQTQLTWTMTAQSERFVLTTLLGGSASGSVSDQSPVSFEVSAKGVGGTAALQGKFAQDGRELTVLPSTVSLQHQVLNLAPLSLALMEGNVLLNGNANFKDPRDPRFHGTLTARGLHWRRTQHNRPRRRSQRQPRTPSQARRH